LNLRPSFQLLLVVVLAHDDDRAASTMAGFFIQRPGVDILDCTLNFNWIGTNFALLAVVTGVEKRVRHGGSPLKMRPNQNLKRTG
jgi:hypothetical protein